MPDKRKPITKKKRPNRQKVKRTPRLRLKDFERQIVVRNTRPEDIDRLIEIQMRCFPGMPTWNREHLESQMRVFPEGQFVVESEGKVVASSSSLVVDFSEYQEWHDWKRIADSGYITNHDAEGDTLYGIEIMVDPDYQGMKLSRRLYTARKDLCRQMNLMRIIIAGRIPGYGAHADEMTAREYVEYAVFKDVYDPVLTPQLANGFILRGLIPDYLKGDTASRGYATHLEWTNVEYVPDGPKQLKAVSHVRICCVQWQMRSLRTFEEFSTQVDFYVDVASDFRADFVVLPELFTLELLSLVEAHRPGEAARQLADFTPRYLDMMRDLAVRYHINIIGGSQFTVEEDSLFNISYLFRRDGTIGKQYKVHITPNERKWWGVSPGEKIEVFDTDRGKVAIAICYDVEFPEMIRYAAAKGARILFVPFNTSERTGYFRVRYCSQARCIENHMYAALAGCVGHLPFVENADIHYAQSAIFSPCDIQFSRGGIIGETSENIAQVLVHDVDAELVRRHRQMGTTQNWKDRRTDLYKVRFPNPSDPENEFEV